jgi:hypothetical protein
MEKMRTNTKRISVSLNEERKQDLKEKRRFVKYSNSRRSTTN